MTKKRKPLNADGATTSTPIVKQNLEAPATKLLIQDLEATPSKSSNPIVLEMMEKRKLAVAEHNRGDGAGASSSDSSDDEAPSLTGMKTNSIGPTLGLDNMMVATSNDHVRPSESLGLNTLVDGSLIEEAGSKSSNAAPSVPIAAPVPNVALESLEVLNGKKTFANALVGYRVGNRDPKQGIQLKPNYTGMDESSISLEDLGMMDDSWKNCLVGYFSPKFHGMQALQNLVNKFQCFFSFKKHPNGWIIFEFNTEEDKHKVLEVGIYQIYGRTLHLRARPAFFYFNEKPRVLCLLGYNYLTYLLDNGKRMYFKESALM